MRYAYEQKWVSFIFFVAVKFNRTQSFSQSISKEQWKKDQWYILSFISFVNFRLSHQRAFGKAIMENQHHNSKSDKIRRNTESERRSRENQKKEGKMLELKKRQLEKKKSEKRNGYLRRKNGSCCLQESHTMRLKSIWKASSMDCDDRFQENCNIYDNERSKSLLTDWTQ